MEMKKLGEKPNQIDGEFFRPDALLYVFYPSPLPWEGKPLRVVENESTYFQNRTGEEVYWTIVDQFRLFPQFDEGFEMEFQKVFDSFRTSKKIQRMERKLLKERAVIRSLQKEIQELKDRLILNLRTDAQLEQRIQRALSNMRMIPVLGKDDTTIEIKSGKRPF